MGEAAAATSAVIVAVSGVGLVGMGLQGTALGLFGLSSIPLLTSIIPKVTTPLFIAGNAAVGWSNTAMTWLFTSSSSVDSIRQTLLSTANQAQNNVKSGNGSVHGTRVHTEFRSLVDNLGSNDIHTEVPYLNGRIVKYGTQGSVRIDVVYGDINDPIAIFDLKTGSAFLSQTRID